MFTTALKGIAICLAIGVAFTFYSRNVEAGPRLEAYVNSHTMTQTSDPEWGGKLVVGWKDFPVYAWGRSDKRNFSILGQRVGVNGTPITAFGVGTNYEIGEGSFFFEAGWAMIDFEEDKRVQREVIYSTLVGNHNVSASTPIPFPSCGYNDHTAVTCNRVDDLTYADGFTARIGIDYQVFKHIKVYAAYNFFESERHMEMGEPERIKNNTGYWEENDTVDLSTFEIGIGVTW